MSNFEPWLSPNGGLHRAGRSGGGSSWHSSCSSSAGMLYELEQSAIQECLKKGVMTFVQLLSATQDPHQGQVSSGSFFLGKNN